MKATIKVTGETVYCRPSLQNSVRDYITYLEINPLQKKKDVVF